MVIAIWNYLFCRYMFSNIDGIKTNKKKRYPRFTVPLGFFDPVLKSKVTPDGGPI